MTEDEAKTKACCGPFREQVPYARAEDRAEIAKGGLDPDYIAEIAARYPCVASACMAWRWSHEKDLDPGLSPKGHCGLAWRPE